MHYTYSVPIKNSAKDMPFKSLLKQMPCPWEGQPGPGRSPELELFSMFLRNSFKYQGYLPFIVTKLSLAVTGLIIHNWSGSIGGKRSCSCCNEAVSSFAIMAQIKKSGKTWYFGYKLFNSAKLFQKDLVSIQRFDNKSSSATLLFVFNLMVRTLSQSWLDCNSKD